MQPYLVEIDSFYFVHRFLQVFLSVQHLVCRDVAAAKVISDGRTSARLAKPLT